MSARHLHLRIPLLAWPTSLLDSDGVATVEFGVRRRVLWGFKLLFGARIWDFGVESYPYQVAPGVWEGKKKGKRSSSTKYLGLAIVVQHFQGVSHHVVSGHSGLHVPMDCAGWTFELGRLASSLHLYLCMCVFTCFVAFMLISHIGSFWNTFGRFFALWCLFSLQPRCGTIVPISGLVGQGCCLGD